MFILLRFLLIFPLIFILPFLIAYSDSPATFPIPETVATFDNVRVSGEEVQRCLLESYASVDLAPRILKTFIQHKMLTSKANKLGLKISARAINMKLAG